MILNKQGCFASRSGSKNGFSLIELLAVMAIMVLMISLAIPGVNAMKGARGLGQSASDLAGTLEMARAHAMAKNTYVFVGIIEEPEKNRLLLALVESKDGSNNHDPNGAWRYWTTTDKNLGAIGKLKILDQVQMADFSSLTTTTGPMASRRSVSKENSVGSDQVGNVAQALFTWPVGASAAQYDFKKVIQFNPRGVVSLEDGSNNNDFVQRMEIGLQQTTDNNADIAITDISKGKLAAVQLDGVSGVTRIFQP